MNATDKNCAIIHDLLVKKDFAALPAHESLMLAEHLRECEACRTFQQVLLNVQQAIQPIAEEMLIPNPTIRQNIRNRISRSIPARPASNGLREAWNMLHDILKLKIPVYQAVLAMAIVFAVFIGIDKVNARGEQETLQRLLSEQNGKQTFVSSEAPHHIARIDSQKIGRSVAEDSLLMKFIVTAM
jgi:hypothetical protein